MKTNSILIFIALLTCCKRDVEVQQSHCTPDNFIVAGVNSKCMVYRDFIPDIDFPITPIGQATEDKKVDINNDHVDDILFSMFTVSGINTTIEVFPLNKTSNKICLNATNLNYDREGYLPYPDDTIVYCSGVILQHKAEDTIHNSNGFWSPLASTYFLDSKNYMLLNDSYKLVNNIWDPTLANKYIGFRFVQNTDTLYGWLQFSVINSHLIIHDCAYQQKY